MTYCNHCGNQLPEGIKFCPKCGKPAAAPAAPAPVAPAPAIQAAPPAPAPMPVPAPQPYTYPAAVQPTNLEEPISTGSYVGIFLLLMIPIVNLLCMLIWACGGCNKRNLTNLSRAMLIWMLISIVLTTLITLAGGLLFGEYLNSANGALDEWTKLLEQHASQNTTQN